MHRLTYFTPTYNRAQNLPKLYESLVNQTDKRFIWLVVDDGSKDNTSELINKWIKENKIEIEYIYKNNGGKHTAIDLSNEVCKTEFINCIDSDDCVSPDSTEILYNYFEKISNNDNICGIVGRRASFEGVPFNNSFPLNNETLYFRELSEKYGYSQDTNLVFKTEIIKKYKFPQFENERFVTESVFYNQFLFDYKMFSIPELLYLGEYQEDGYTVQGLRLFYKNPEGYLYALKQNAYYSIKNNDSLKIKIARATHFYSWKKALKLKEKYNQDYKLPLIFRIIGAVLSGMFIKKYKKGYQEFKSEKK